MTEKTNPYLEQENYYQGYQDSIDGLKNKPDVVEMDKLCYFVFNTDDGKKLLDEITERFLIPGFISPNGKSVQYAAVYFEGFKEAFRMIRNCIRSHKQRIEAESVKQ